MKVKIEVTRNKNNKQILETAIINIEMEEHVVALDVDWEERFLEYITKYLQDEIKGTSELE